MSSVPEEIETVAISGISLGRRTGRVLADSWPEVAFIRSCASPEDQSDRSGSRSYVYFDGQPRRPPESVVRAPLDRSCRQTHLRPPPSHRFDGDPRRGAGESVAEAEMWPDREREMPHIIAQDVQSVRVLESVLIPVGRPKKQIDRHVMRNFVTAPVDILPRHAASALRRGHPTQKFLYSAGRSTRGVLAQQIPLVAMLQQLVGPDRD